jgi:hypothetical protein
MSARLKKRVTAIRRNTNSSPQTRWRYVFARWAMMWLLAVFLGNVALAANLTIEPTSHDFGSINVDTASGDKTFTLLNESDTLLQLDFIDVFGNVTTTIDDDGNVATAFGYQTFNSVGNPITVSEFVISDDACSGEELGVIPDSSAKCELAMRFEPKEEGTKTLNISIPYIDEFGNPTSLTLPLFGKGTGIPIPNIEATIMSHDFGDVIVGESSDIQVIRLSNTGEADLVIDNLSISGDADINILPGFDLCSGKTISQDENCSIRVQFSPTTTGEKEAIISVPSNDPDTPTLEIGLRGNGIDPPMPNIEVDPMEVNFGDIQVGIASYSQNVIVHNTGNAALEIGQITVSGDGFEIINDNCSTQNVVEMSKCMVTMKFEPTSIGVQTGTLSIPSNDPDMPVTDVSLSGNGVGWCQGNYQQDFYYWPWTPNFGTELVGSSTSMSLGVYSYARGCDALQIADVVPTGDHGDEFSVDDLQCYHGSWSDWSYSSCRFKTVFTPSEAGTKNAELTVTYTDTTTETMPLQAAALASGQPNMSASPSSHDFGTVTAGSRYWSNHLRLTLKNTGNVNLHIGDIEMIGEDADDFRGHEWSWCAYKGVLYPTEECDLYIYFMPRTAGSKQAELSIDSDASNTPTLIALSGTAEEPKDCSDENITIESSGNDGDGGVWATKTGNNNWWNQYTGDSDAWTRLTNPNGNNGTAAPNRPTEGDIVRINAGHTIVGIPYATVRALCIEENATLTSMEPSDSNGDYYPYLQVNATDYIENKGTIKGLHGADETDNATSCAQWWWYNTSENCAKPGASVSLSVGCNLGRFRNEGSIFAGNGGDGKQYGAFGGWLDIYGSGLTNTDDIGLIRAGRGGSITGTQSGRGGRGGGVSIWGNDSLYSDGIGIYGGNGGNCNPAATEAQYGGNGGNMRLNARNTVDLLGGTFATGKGGTNCEPLGEDGRDGGFNTDPSVLNLSGTNTKIEGGDLTIFGGDGWTINMNDLSDTALTATGDITIAVGPGGSVNMTGSSGDILKSGGKVTVLADNILLDDGVKLEDIVEAADGVVVGPGQILRDVSVTAPNKVSGDPKAVVPITITLSNGGPEEDTFLLSVTDSEGWTLSSLPTTRTLAGLASIKIDLNVTLPATVGAVDVVTVSAISLNDPEASAKTQIQVSVIEPVNGMAEIDEGVLNLPGVDIVINGGDVMITSADGNIDLSNVSGSKPIVTATGNITLAVGINGVIDLRGNNSRILDAKGKVFICADPSKVLPQGINLSTLVGNFEFCPIKPAYAVSLMSPGDLFKPEGSIVSLRFTLKNEGLKADTYKLNVTDSLGLPLTQLLPKRLKGLASAELLLNVTMNSKVGLTDVVTVKAISQTEPSQKAIATVRITTTLSRTSTYTPSIGGGAAACSSTGDITGLCSNRGGVLKDIAIQERGSVSGGSLEGTIDLKGIVGQLTVESGAVVKGSDSAKVTGRVINKGDMSDFEFVGGSITCEPECKFSGDIRNNSKVGGKFVNPRFAANASLTGGAIQGVTTGDANGYALLRNVTVKAGSQLKYVILGDGVVLGKNVTLIDVSFSTGVHLKNVKVSGLITGDSGKPALLENATVQTGSRLSNMRIGQNVQLPEDVQFEGNVRFNRRSAIPEGMELINMLPELLGAPHEGMVYPRRADLSADVVEPGDGILSAINNLAMFKENGWILSQNSDSGCLELTVDPLRACILPVSLKKAIANAGISMKDDIIGFLTENGLDVQTQPALQAPNTLQKLLSEIALSELIVQANGNLRVSDGSGELWFSARSNWWGIEVDANAETGLSFVQSPYGQIVATMTFSDKEGKKWKQLLFPAVAYPEVLKASAKSVSLKPYGVVDFTLNDQRYCGVINYAVEPNTAPSTDTLQIESISDMTGDGVEDIKLIYPSGEKQLMYRQACD